MSSLRLGVPLDILFALPACIYDGMYLVQGTVKTGSPDALKPVSEATVVARSGRAGTAQEPVSTRADGTYTAEYRFGSIILPTSGGDPFVQYEAPGYQPKLVRLNSDKAESGVTRSNCPERTSVPCFQLDVVLLPK